MKIKKYDSFKHYDKNNSWYIENCKIVRPRLDQPYIWNGNKDNGKDADL